MDCFHLLNMCCFHCLKMVKVGGSKNKKQNDLTIRCKSDLNSFFKIGFTVNRKPENGGDVTYNTYQELETSFANQELHPADFKQSVENYINKLLDPIRADFDTPELK